MVGTGLAGPARVETPVDRWRAPTIWTVRIWLTPVPRIGNESERLAVSLRYRLWCPVATRMFISIFSMLR
jgi:hypothetical protein